VRVELILAALLLAGLAGPRMAFPTPRFIRRRASRLAARRAAGRVEDQLPLAAAELAAHVRAGRSLAQAIAGCAEDLPQPVASHMRSAAHAVSLGKPPGEAVRELGTGEEVRLIAAAVQLQARVGGDLSDVLDRMSGTLLERRAQRRAAAVATAQARATARMVSGLPLVGIGGLFLVDRAALSALLTSPLGWAALAVSAALTVVAHLLIRRIARVIA